MAEVGNWTRENCSTVGFGSLIFTGTSGNLAKFSDTIGVGNQFWYSIENGDDREAGIATLVDAATASRDTILATLVNGIYNASTPTAISLSGSAAVSCSLTKNAFDSKEDAFSKNTAFNKNFGTGATDVPTGDHTHPGVGVQAAELNTTNKNLTVASSNYQVADGPIAYVLPDATTLSTGGMLYQIQNDSSSSVAVADGDNVTLFNLDAASTAIMSLKDNSASAGVWSRLFGTLAAFFMDTDITEFNPELANADSSRNSLTRLTDTRALLVYREPSATESGYPRARVVDINGNTLTVGPILGFGTEPPADEMRVERLDDNKAIVVYEGSNGTTVYNARVLSISGDVVTASAVTAIASTVLISAPNSKFSMCMQPLSATQAVITYNDPDNSNYLTASILDVDGSNVITETVTVLDNTGAASNMRDSLISLTSTKCMVTYLRDVAAVKSAVSLIFTISSSVATPGSITTLNASDDNHSDFTSAKLSDTSVMVFYDDSVNSICILADTSGASPVFGTPFAFQASRFFIEGGAAITHGSSKATYFSAYDANAKAFTIEVASNGIDLSLINTWAYADPTYYIGYFQAVKMTDTLGLAMYISWGTVVDENVLKLIRVAQ